MTRATCILLGAVLHETEGLTESLETIDNLTDTIADEDDDADDVRWVRVKDALDRLHAARLELADALDDVRVDAMRSCDADDDPDADEEEVRDAAE